MGVEAFSSLGRPLDPAYTSNRGIAAFSALVLAGAVVIEALRGRPILSALVFGFVTAITVFLAWALARELDPDHDVSAFLAAGFALVGVWVAYPPGLLGLFLILLLFRIVNRSTGLPARPIDSAVVSLLATFLTWSGAWYLGVAAAAAFWLDARLRPSHRPQYYVSVAMLIVVIAYGATNGEGFGLAPALLAGGAIWAVAVVPLLATLAMIPLIGASRDVRSYADHGGDRLNPERVRAAQVLGLAIGWGAVFTLGWAGLKEILPLWAVLFACGLWSVQARRSSAGSTWKEPATGQATTDFGIRDEEAVRDGTADDHTP